MPQSGQVIAECWHVRIFLMLRSGPDGEKVGCVDNLLGRRVPPWQLTGKEYPVAVTAVWKERSLLM
jgi:hypothetical protein